MRCNEFFYAKPCRIVFFITMYSIIHSIRYQVPGTRYFWYKHADLFGTYSSSCINYVDREISLLASGVLILIDKKETKGNLCNNPTNWRVTTLFDRGSWFVIIRIRPSINNRTWIRSEKNQPSIFFLMRFFKFEILEIHLLFYVTLVQTGSDLSENPDSIFSKILIRIRHPVINILTAWLGEVTSFPPGINIYSLQVCHFPTRIVIKQTVPSTCIVLFCIAWYSY